jgi:DNA polymerase elongation subunit (family B)
MSYVDALYSKDTDEILVVERVDGQRVFKSIPANYVFYYEDPRGGRYKDMWGRPVSKCSYTSNKTFKKELHLRSGKKIFESDINPVFRCLEENYNGASTPILNIGFFDIEVDFDPLRGFASPWDPFSAITAISIYLSHEEKMVTLVLKPNLPENDKDHLTWEAAEGICNSIPDTYLCNDEAQLLSIFLDLCEECDVLSGWNSKGFDIPYVVNRIERILGKDYSKRLCLWNQRPKRKKYIQFKKEQETYELVGRIHLDYLELYKKHNPQELHSYRLDYVGEIEVGENKVPYEGSLDNLYKRDFKKFIEYNRQDTLLLYKIDQKKRFIELANQIAHTNTVLLPTTMGSVALIEQAIINEAHGRGVVVPNRKRPDWDADIDDSSDDDEDEDGAPIIRMPPGQRPVVGAYVAKPKIGIHREIACCDINSLYPSALRSLNMGPETLVGQIRSDRTNSLLDSRLAGGTAGPECWEGLFSTLEYEMVRDKSQDMLVVDFEDGNSIQVSGEQLYNYIFKEGNPFCISANGTIFRTDVEAIIPGLLARWYSERKTMQFKETVYSEALEASKGFGLTKNNTIDTEFVNAILGATPADDVVFGDLPDYIKAKDAEHIAGLIAIGHIALRDGKIFIEDVCKAEAKELKSFWNQRQQARKILLNSLYGALLNESCRFYDARIGQSVTLTGRSIAKHMNSKVNEIITGVYDYKGDAVIYADTDSSYFTAYHMLKSDPELAKTLDSREAMIELYDGIGEAVNDSFPGFMTDAFNTGLDRGSIIKAGRELIGSSGLFITKKRYALLMYDKDNVRLDVNGKPGKIKAMGLDLKRADTPKMMQEFLEKILVVLLDGGEKDDIIGMIKEFRNDFRSLDGWLKGTPKKVNGITGYVNRIGQGSGKDLMKAGIKEKVRIPGHVQAAINWNTLRTMYGDNYSLEIQDGQKVIVCKLKPNALKMDSVAYPIDQMSLPEWYKELPFDHEEMENTIIDKKVSNLIGVLKWDLSVTREDTTFNDLFSF